MASAAQVQVLSLSIIFFLVFSPPLFHPSIINPPSIYTMYYLLSDRIVEFSRISDDGQRNELLRSFHC